MHENSATGRRAPLPLMETLVRGRCHLDVDEDTCVRDGLTSMIQRELRVI